jgi:RHS repeat-associated protein
VEKDTAREALAALEADPDREPLAKYNVEPEAAAGPYTVAYTNDAINRLSVNDSRGTVINYTPNGLNQYTAVSGFTPPSYDANFNLSGYTGWTFIYDADKRLKSAYGNGHNAQFVYDGLGRCVRRTIDTVTTVLTYDEWKPIAEWTGAGGFVAWNLYGPGADEILVRNQPDPAGYLYYHLDAMGNVVFLLSQGSQAMMGLEKYTYDAFGKPTITGWNGNVRPISNYGNRFLFTGREYLYTLGIYDYRHRHYHPGLGRFIQTDPIGFGGDPMNLYRYCGGNPITHSDPTGLVTINSPDWQWSRLMWEQGNSPYGFSELYTAYVNQAAGNDGGGGGSGGARTISARDEGPKGGFTMAYQERSCTIPSGNQSESYLLRLNGKLVWDPNVNKWVLIPQNVSLDSNIREAKTMSSSSWVKAVNVHGKWDYKDRGPYRDFGNINYGATGRAQGWSSKTLQAAGVAFKYVRGTHTPLETGRDQHMIRIGIDYYDKNY